MRTLFHWDTFDVRNDLPPQWDEELKEVARSQHRDRVLRANHSTSREADSDARLLSKTVGGASLGAAVPWLVELYRGIFRDLAQRCSRERVAPMEDARFACVLNVQIGVAQRYECHVDSNPIEGLLYATSHPEGSGGELVVANDDSAVSPEEVDKDCSIIYPQRGHLVFFDARRFSHYVRALTATDSMRVVAAMNYYTPSCPESSRPDGLNYHLSGHD